MSNQNATIEEWKSLYDAAAKFKETKCWEWMDDADIFGVQDVDTGETGYCCIMGNGGWVFGLNVYLGDTGLKCYMQMLHDMLPAEDLGFIQHCLALSFDDREMLDKKDLEIINNLGLKFRGKNQWPLFRNYSPGLYPWYLDRDEVKYLTYALEQAIDVAMRCRDSKELIEPEDERQILVRTACKNNGGLVWKDEYVTLQIKDEDPERYRKMDETALKRVKNRNIKKCGIWEVDFFHIPFPVREKGRPYYPMSFTIADGQAEIILKMEITSDFDGYISKFQNMFIEFLENSEVVPETVVVQRKEAYLAFEPVARRLGIDIRPVEELFIIQKFRASLRDRM